MADGKHQVLVIGGGFGGLSATRALAGADVQVTLVDRTNHHLFQPLLYQWRPTASRISTSRWPGILTP
jgi:NADH:quinone reductase (non-electrogenic)